MRPCFYERRCIEVSKMSIFSDTTSIFSGCANALIILQYSFSNDEQVECSHERQSQPGVSHEVLTKLVRSFNCNFQLKHWQLFFTTLKALNALLLSLPHKHYFYSHELVLYNLHLFVYCEWLRSVPRPKERLLAKY